jgi:hypothetical protein
MCYNENRNHDRKRSEFETPPNATSCVCFHFDSYSINTERKAFWPLPEPHMGPRIGLGIGREDARAIGRDREVGSWM